MEAPPNASSCAELKQQGNAAFKRRDYAAAVDLYARALLDPEADGASRAAILSNRAIAHFKLGCYAQSAADAEASLELEHGSQKARYRAALAHLMLGQPLAAQPHVAALTAPFGLEAEASAEVKTAAEASGPNAATKVAAPPQLLPAHLAILQEATCAMLRHHTLKHQQEQEQLGAVSTSDRAGGSGRSAAAAGCHRTSELLQVLSDDMDGEADADIVSVLQELSCLLCTSGAARAVFELHNGFPLVLCYLTEAYCSRAAEVLQAASGWQQGQAKRQGYGATALEESQQPGGSNGEQEPGRGAVMWPPLVWRRLVAAAVGGNSAGGGSTLVATAMQLLSWAAGDPWARTQLLVHPLPGAAAEGAVQAQQAQHGQHGQRSAAGCPLEAVVLGLQRLGAAGGLAPAAVPAAVELLARYGEDAASAEALAALRLSPLHTLLRAFQAVEPLLAAAPAAPSGTALAASSNGQPSLLPEDEQAALEQLREKQRAVYDARVVMLRRAVLRALAALCGQADLVCAEVARGGKATGAAAPGKGGFLAALVKLVQGLHEQSPKRTGAVLGPDGRPKSFSKKPFAADFKDNPAGDFLAGLDLEAGGAYPLGKPSSTAGKGGATGGSQPPTLLELALSALLRAVGSGGAAGAAQLFKLDVLGLCEALWAYTTPAVVSLAQELCGAVAERHAAAFSELLLDGSVLGLASVLQYTALPGWPSATSPSLQPGSHATLAAASNAVYVAGAVQRAGSSTDAADAAVAAARAQLVQRSLDKLAALVDSCSGDEFAHVTQQPGVALLRAFDLAQGAADAAQGAADALAAGLSQGPPSGVTPAAPTASQCSAEGIDGAAAAAGLHATARRFVLLCCDRAQRQQGLQRAQRPRGGAWDRLSPGALQALLAPNESSKAATAVVEGGKENQNDAGASGDIGEGLSQLKRGFLSGRKPAAPTRKPPQAQAQPGPPAELATGPQLEAAQAVLIEDITEQQPQPGMGQQQAVQLVAEAGEAAALLPSNDMSSQEQVTAQQPASPDELAQLQRLLQAVAAQPGGDAAQRSVLAARIAEQVATQQQLGAEEAAQLAQLLQAAAAQQVPAGAAGEEEGCSSSDSDAEDLADVFDSTPSPEVRQVRNAWMAVPLGDKVRWDQTSSDVNAWVVMPPGTRARDVKVTVAVGSLTVSLGWYGRVVDGRLHRRVKASEAQWCMEDNEVHIILPKDDNTYWKALFEGSEEKSYYELLKEAVNSDEAPVPYDQMDDRAKELLGSMLERQALINEGLIDPEGFDDFRVVLGESSLKA